MNPSNETVGTCYVLPMDELAQARGRILRITNPVFAQARRYECLDAFCRQCAGLDGRSAA